MQWQDATSYHRGDKEHRATTWTAQAGAIKIAVTRGHIHYPGVWLLVAEPFYSAHQLDEVDLEDIAGAQARAIDLVRMRVQQTLAALD